MSSIDCTQTYDVLLASGEVKTLDLKSLLQQQEKTLLFIYPKDNTPWCTKENKDFTCLKEEFEKIWIHLIGVSKDSIASHQRFVEKQQLWIDLLSDLDLILHKSLWAYGEKKNYGKIYMGVIRSTFLINRQGEILEAWRNVKATGHAERILAKMKKLKE